MEQECKTFHQGEKRHGETPLMNHDTSNFCLSDLKVNNLGSSEPSLKTYFDVKTGNFKAGMNGKRRRLTKEILDTVFTSPALRSCNIKTHSLHRTGCYKPRDRKPAC